MHIATFITAHFRKIYWLSVLWLVLGSAFSFFVVLPVDETSTGVYMIGYWLPIFVPALIAFLLTLVAVVGTFRRTRTWWGTLGYVLVSCVTTIYAYLAFLIVTFLLYGFS